MAFLRKKSEKIRIFFNLLFWIVFDVCFMRAGRLSSYRLLQSHGLWIVFFRRKKIHCNRVMYGWGKAPTLTALLYLDKNCYTNCMDPSCGGWRTATLVLRATAWTDSFTLLEWDDSSLCRKSLSFERGWILFVSHSFNKRKVLSFERGEFCLFRIRSTNEKPSLSRGLFRGIDEAWTRNLRRDRPVL